MVRDLLERAFAFRAFGKTFRPCSGGGRIAVLPLMENGNCSFDLGVARRGLRGDKNRGCRRIIERPQVADTSDEFVADFSRWLLLNPSARGGQICRGPLLGEIADHAASSRFKTIPDGEFQRRAGIGSGAFIAKADEGFLAPGWIENSRGDCESLLPPGSGRVCRDRCIGGKHSRRGQDGGPEMSDGAGGR